MLYAEHAMESAIDPVLIIDDEEDIARLLSYNLREAGLPNEAVHTAQAGLTYLAKTRPSVVILDLMLPDLPGTDVLKKIRTTPALADVGVLMLTARGDEIDRVVGFELGADDYVVKPFSVREVVLRVKALARRARTGEVSEDPTKRLKWRGLELDPVRHKVLADGAELSLRPIEFKFVALLLENPGRLYSRADILRELWGDAADVSPRTIDTHVRRLRDALGPYEQAVETVHGFGYRLREA